MQQDFSEKPGVQVRLKWLVSDLYRMCGIAFPEEREMQDEAHTVRTCSKNTNPASGN